MLRITTDDDGAHHMVAPDSAGPVGSLRPLRWESEFFDLRLGGLSLDTTRATALEAAPLRAALDELLAAADRAGYELVQLHLDVSGLALAPLLEDAGFRLVDSRVSFLTRMDKSRLPAAAPATGTVRLAVAADLDAVLELTRAGFTDNPALFSRYKNRDFFPAAASERWFAAWIENHFHDTDTLFAVWDVASEVVGYFAYKRSGTQQGEPLYKGLLVAVAPEYAGHRAHLFLQTFLYEQIPHRFFWLDNTTQLTNLPTLRNHVTSQKKLEKIELTFFRRGRL